MIRDYEDLFSLKGKRALVTGGAQGLGLSIAEAFCAAGAVVTLADINADSVEAAVAELRQEGAQAYAVVCDVSSEEQVAAAVASAAEQMGGLDIMVANAGVSTRAPAEEMTLDQWNRVIDIDLKGVFLCDREAGRYMLTHGGGSSQVELDAGRLWFVLCHRLVQKSLRSEDCLNRFEICRHAQTNTPFPFERGPDTPDLVHKTSPEPQSQKKR